MEKRLSSDSPGGDTMNKNRSFIKISLSRFDVPNTNTTGSAGMSVEMKTFYDKVLIRTAEPDLVYDQFGQQRDIPAGGGKTIEFRKFNALPKSTTPLTEGVTPDGRSISATNITATVSQYGDYVTLSDVLQETAIDNTIVETTQMIGGQAGRTLDTITRENLMGGTNIMFAPKIVDGKETAVVSRSGLDATCIFNPKYVYRAERLLKRMNAPKINGKYVAVIHPDVSADIMENDLFINVTKYAKEAGTFKGEVGTIGNTRFVESSEAKIWKDASCPAGLAVYGILFLGRDAYGITKTAKGGLRTIIKSLGSAGTADPLDQRSTIGWKATKTAVRLVEEYMLRFECVSAVSGIVTAN